MNYPNPEPRRTVEMPRGLLILLLVALFISGGYNVYAGVHDLTRAAVAVTAPWSDAQVAAQVNTIVDQYPGKAERITAAQVPGFLTVACQPGSDNFYRQDLDPVVWKALEALLARSGRCSR